MGMVIAVVAVVAELTSDGTAMVTGIVVMEVMLPSEVAKVISDGTTMVTGTEEVTVVSEVTEVIPDVILVIGMVIIEEVATPFPVAFSALKSGPVRFFCPKRTDQDRDQSTYFLKLKKTGPGPQKTEDCGLLQSSETLTTSLGPVF